MENSRLVVRLYHSGSCAATPTDLWLSSPNIGAGTTWNTAAAGGWWEWLGRTTGNANKTDPDCGPQPDVNMVWSGAALQNALQRAANGSWGPDGNEMGLGLVAQNEDDRNQWKKFYPGGDGQATLIVNYNRVPNVPTAQAISPCSSACSSPALVSSLQARLSVRVWDNDGNTMRVPFEVWLDDLSARVAYTNYSVTGVANDGIATWTQNTPRANGTRYRWRARACDAHHCSDWTPWFTFTTDVTNPSLPVVSSADYPSGPDLWSGGPGVEGTFTFGPNNVADVVEYRWSLDQSPPVNVVTAAADGTASATITPMKDGQRFLYVMSIDGAGNASEIREYSFKVSAPPPVEAWWPLDEDSGTSAADVVLGHTATLSGGASWSPGLFGNCLTLNGSTGHASTSGQVLATNQTFTVAAWVRLTDISGFRTVVSQDGNRSSAFYLQYRHDVDRWAFTMRVSDTDAGQSFSSFSDYRPIPTEEWTHLIGVYDAAAGKLLLYVDGVLQAQQTPFTSSWASSGGVQIGRGKYAGGSVDFFAGDIDDVRVFQRTLQPLEISRLSDKD